MKLFSTLISLFITSVIIAQQISIIPEPASINVKAGIFQFNNKTKIFYQKDTAATKTIANFIQQFEQTTGIKLNASETSDSSANCIIIHTAPIKESVSNEAYILDISANKIRITAAGEAGLFYAFESIKQLLPAEKLTSKTSKYSIPCAYITDYPAYAYRGMHLDVSRHFFPASFIKKYIDILAAFKINKFHWHLTDSHGWRLEIKQYPKLTSIGAWRADTKDTPMTISQPTQLGAAATYGGFYTQEEVKDIIQYAKERYITIIPEIEMPGHCTAALVAYPEYTCLNNKVPLLMPTGYAGDLLHNFCVGYDSTYVFLENILTEVMQLFPSAYIHIGGDEVRGGPWLTCPRCNKLMQEKNFTTAKQLQAYFTERIDSFVTAKGKKIMGWEEILWANVSHQSASLVWHGPEGAIPHIKRGYDIVMTPYHYTYFDFYQSPPNLEPDITYAGLPLDTVYAFNPTPKGISSEEAKHVLGGQAAMWTENISTSERVEYMLLPRMLALSEALWTPVNKKNYDKFVSKTEQQFKKWEHENTNYAKSLYNVNIQPVFDSATKTLAVRLYDQTHHYPIYYTKDGSTPTMHSVLYKGPVTIKQSCILKTATFGKGKQLGKLNEDYLSIHKALGAPLKSTLTPSETTSELTKKLLDGIHGTVEPYDGRWITLQDSVTRFTIELKQQQNIQSVSVRFMEDEVGNIFLPKHIEYAISSDGKSFNTVENINIENIPQQKLRHIENYKKEGIHKQAKYIRVTIQNANLFKEAEKNMIFMDEIVVE